MKSLQMNPAKSFSLKNTAPEVIELEKAYNERLAQKPFDINQAPKILSPKILSRVMVPHSASLSSLKNIFNFPQATYKFLCKVKVTAYFPKNIVDFVRPYCAQCKKCFVVDVIVNKEGERCPSCAGLPSPDQEEHHRYFFALQLTDSSDNRFLNASLYHFDACHFLNDIPPVDLRVNNVSLSAIKKKMERLLQGNTLINCVITSYLVHKKEGPQRRYRIMDTVLTIDE